MVEKGSQGAPEGWAETPKGLEDIPQIYLVDKVPLGGSSFRKKVDVFLKEHNDIVKRAENSGKDIVAWTRAHGTEIVVGVGIASTLGAVGLVIHHYIEKKGGISVKSSKKS